MNNTGDSFSVIFTNAAWCSDPGVSRSTIEGGRPFVVVPRSVQRIWTENCADELPCHSSWTDSDGVSWRRFELPALSSSGVSPEAQIACEQHRVVIASEATRDQWRDLLQTENTSQFFCSTIEDLIDRHIEVVSALYDSQPSEGLGWQGNAHGVAFRSCKSVASRWLESASSAEPRMALVVKLANSLPDLLDTVCNRPRHTLRRERQLQPLARIQQVDSACLRWLARQPGGNVAEKAGMKQRALAVVRVEDIDTPENRVVRDLLRRGITACERYLREYRSEAEHPRVQLVGRFQRHMQELASSSLITGAQRLAGVPQPNYVLQHDPRYRTLWGAYQQLVRQQILEDSVWRWRHRLFAEHLQMCALAALSRLAAGSLTGTGDVLLRLEQSAGQFIDPRTMLGGWSTRDASDGQIDFVLGCQLQIYPFLPQEFCALASDFLLVRRLGDKVLAIASFWCVLEFTEGNEKSDDRLRSIAVELQRSGTDRAFRGVLIQPGEQECVEQRLTVQQLGNVRRIRLGLPVQNDFDQLVEQIRWALQLT